MIVTLQGDIREQLATLDAESVHCAVTSPPYWGLRSYLPDGHPLKPFELGSEPTPREYVDKMVHALAAVHRVLRVDGTFWLNIGDTWARAAKEGAGLYYDRTYPRARGRSVSGVTPGQVVGVPWMLAFALRDWGWHLRQEIIWHKPNPMTESVRDRCTKAHEQIFLLTKTPRYYFDQVAIEEPVSGGAHSRGKGRPGPKSRGKGEQQIKSNARYHANCSDLTLTRNKRSVWTVGVGRYKGAHFAVFPEKLIEPCILAGTSRHGVCAACGAPWRRMVKRTRVPTRPGADTKTAFSTNGHATPALAQGNRDPARHVSIRETVGWAPVCECGAHVGRPVVLDPFAGSGTTAVVAERLGCHCILVDLHPEYLALQRQRIGLA